MLRNELKIPLDARVLLTAGRLVSVKGHVHLFEALSLLPATIGGHPLYLMVLGDGVLRPRLTAQAAQAGLNRRIVWAGWQSDPAPYYNSRTWWSSLPTRKRP